jgi:hypothetical protein
MTERKKCSSCNRRKPLTDFYAHPRTKDGLQSQCWKCMSRAANERNKRNRQAKKALVEA